MECSPSVAFGISAAHNGVLVPEIARPRPADGCPMETISVVAVIRDAPEVVLDGLDALFGAPEMYNTEDEAVVAVGGAIELKITIKL